MHAPLPAETAETETRRPRAQAWYALSLLTLVYTFNNVDRRVVSIVFEPLKKEFGLSDGQLGLLTGLALGLPFALAVVPMGLLADRVNRRNMLAGVLFVWSALTAAAGAAQSYLALVAARVVVGAAEAGSSPAAISIVSDLFPPQRRTGASAIYQSGNTLGALLCLVVGGYVVAHYGWRAAFLMAGVPGMLLALLLLFTLKNPPRGAMDPPSPGGQARGFKAAAAFILGNGAILHMVFAPSLLSAGNTGILNWAVSFLIRLHGFDVQQAGLAVALSQAIGSGAGLIFSGLVSDRITGGRPDRVITVILACLAVTVAAAVGFILAPTSLTCLIAFGFYSMACFNFVGLGYGALLNMTPAPLRGTVLGVELVSTNLVGYAGGPVVVGFLSDAFGSLRYGMLAILVFYVWGLFHFLRARTLARRMPAMA